MAAFGTRSRDRDRAEWTRSRLPGDRVAPRPRGVRRYRNRAPSRIVELPAVPEATTPLGATGATDADSQSNE
ncbi:hypothetical protein ELS17_16905 [Natrinema altunense]|uniref:Uncharacterized protein n=1 Tax=Natrinema altunense TaxID=222984 RepID=A0A482XUJ2_9EURY|nr:hypothetical protein ELS17_16905 [Natrinema altunense]